jgi:outer membrane protein
MRFTQSTRRLGSLAVLALSMAAPVVASADTLSAEEAVRLAAQQNPTLKAALLDTQTARLATQGEENARVPTFAASMQGSYSENIASDSRGDSESLQGSAAFQFSTDIGTQIETGIESNVGWRNLNSFGISSLSGVPTTSADAYLSVRQPLLRGAGEDSVLASLEQARASETQAELSRDLTASQTALDVMNAYWELWYAERAVAVQEQALKIAKKQVTDAEARESTLGVGSKVDVLSFSSSEASIEEALSSARTSRDTKAISLGRVLGMSPAASVALSASSEPPMTAKAPETISSTALAQRSPELLGLRSQLDAADIRIQSAADAALPKLDVFSKVSVGAVWLDDSYSGFALPGGRPAFTIMAGLELEIPMGESKADAAAAQARSQQEALAQRYQAKADSIEAEVSSLGVELSAADRQVQLSTKTAQISSQLAEAERQRMELGTGDPTDVVKAEQSAREAELKRLRAVVSRATTQLSFEHSSGALLDRFGSVFSKRSS